MTEQPLLSRIMTNPGIFGGKPIIRGRRLAVKQVLGMLAVGDATDDILEGYPYWKMRTSGPVRPSPIAL